MSLQISAIRTAFEDLKHDISDISPSVFIRWCNWASQQVYRDVAAEDPERYIQESSMTASDTSKVDLPSDFKNVQPLGTGFYIDESNIRLTPTGYGRSEQGYYITGGKVVFTGINTSTSIVLRYLPKVTKLISVDEYLTIDGTETGAEVIPDEYERMLLDDLDVLYSQQDESSGLESLADFRFSRLLGEMLTDINQDVKVYQIDNYVNNF